MSEKKSNWDKIGVFAGVATTLLSGYVATLVYGMNLKHENLHQAIQIESDTKYESKVDHSFDFQQLKSGAHGGNQLIGDGLGGVRLSAGDATYTSTNNLYLSGSLVATNGHILPPITTGPSGVTNGISAIWNSNGVTYLRSSPLGATTNADKQIGP